MDSNWDASDRADFDAYDLDDLVTRDNYGDGVLPEGDGKDIDDDLLPELPPDRSAAELSWIGDVIDELNRRYEPRSQPVDTPGLGDELRAEAVKSAFEALAEDVGEETALVALAILLSALLSVPTGPVGALLLAARLMAETSAPHAAGSTS